MQSFDDAIKDGEIEDFKAYHKSKKNIKKLKNEEKKLKKMQVQRLIRIRNKTCKRWCI